MMRIDCTQTYLGNYFQQIRLQQDIDVVRPSHSILEVELTQADQKKSRIYAKAHSGDTIGLLKQRDWQFTHGDVFQLEGDRLLVIHLESQLLMVLSIETFLLDNSLKLIHLGHTLGNHHYPIVVTTDKIYVQISDDSTHIEETIRAFNIDGLRIEYERRSPNQVLSFATHHH